MIIIARVARVPDVDMWSVTLFRDTIFVFYNFSDLQ